MSEPWDNIQTQVRRITKTFEFWLISNLELPLDMHYCLLRNEKLQKSKGNLFHEEIQKCPGTESTGNVCNLQHVKDTFGLSRDRELFGQQLNNSLTQFLNVAPLTFITANELM